jgi:hypothetical protein
MLRCEMAPTPGRTQHPETGRIVLRYDTFALLEVARVVLFHAAALANKSPLDVIQDEYDSARVPAGYATSKRAWRIVGQLGTTWDKLKATLLLDGAEYTRTIAQFDWRERRAFSDDVIIKALRVVALRLSVDTLRPDPYDKELERLNREERARYRHGAGVAASFPFSPQIDSQFGWDAALALAGLEPRTGAPRVKGLPAIDVVEMFLEDLGYLPSSFKTLAKYAADKRVSLADPEGSRMLAPVFPVLQARRLPKWTPSAPPPPGDPLPPWNVVPLNDPAVAPQNGRGTWGLAGCIESLITVADEIELREPGVKLTQATYRKHQVGRRDLGLAAHDRRGRKEEQDDVQEPPRPGRPLACRRPKWRASVPREGPRSGRADRGQGSCLTADGTPGAGGATGMVARTAPAVRRRAAGAEDLGDRGATRMAAFDDAAAAEGPRRDTGDGEPRQGDEKRSLAAIGLDVGRSWPNAAENASVPNDGLIGVSCGHRVPREVVRVDGRNLYWCETCGHHRMSGTAGSGLASFDWLLMLKDEITMRDIVVYCDEEPKPHQRSVVEALGASLVVRRQRAA